MKNAIDMLIFVEKLFARGGESRNYGVVYFYLFQKGTVYNLITAKRKTKH